MCRTEHGAQYRETRINRKKLKVEFMVEMNSFWHYPTTNILYFFIVRFFSPDRLILKLQRSC